MPSSSSTARAAADARRKATYAHPRGAPVARLLALKRAALEASNHVAGLKKLDGKMPNLAKAAWAVVICVRRAPDPRKGKLVREWEELAAVSCAVQPVHFFLFRFDRRHISRLRHRRSMLSRTSAALSSAFHGYTASHAHARGRMLLRCFVLTGMGPLLEGSAHVFEALEAATDAATGGSLAGGGGIESQGCSVVDVRGMPRE